MRVVYTSYNGVIGSAIAYAKKNAHSSIFKAYGLDSMEFENELDAWNAIFMFV